MSNKTDTSTSSGPVSSGSPLGDRDLMAFFDGELEEAELEGLLEEQESNAKLVGLEVVQQLVREHVDGDDRADGIADAVMAAIEAEQTTGSDADEDVAGEGLPEARLPEARPPEAASGPANDNSRNVWGVFAVAAAVAAGLFFWGDRGARDWEQPTAQLPATTSEAPADVAQPAPETLGKVAMGAPQEGPAAGEDEDAVEISNLEFGEGERTGSIHKVDNENTGVHTAVVWVTDFGDDE